MGKSHFGNWLMHGSIQQLWEATQNYPLDSWVSNHGAEFCPSSPNINVVDTEMQHRDPTSRKPAGAEAAAPDSSCSASGVCLPRWRSRPSLELGTAGCVCRRLLVGPSAGHSVTLAPPWGKLSSAGLHLCPFLPPFLLPLPSFPHVGLS